MKFFSRLEADRFSRCNADLCAGPGVTADSGLPRFHRKYAKSAQFDPVARHERLFHTLEDGVHRCFGFGARKPRSLDNALNQILLDQEEHTFLVRSPRATCELPASFADILTMLEIHGAIVNAIRLP